METEALLAIEYDAAHSNHSPLLVPVVGPSCVLVGTVFVLIKDCCFDILLLSFWILAAMLRVFRVCMILLVLWRLHHWVIALQTATLGGEGWEVICEVYGEWDWIRARSLCSYAGENDRALFDWRRLWLCHVSMLLGMRQLFSIMGHIVNHVCASGMILHLLESLNILNHILPRLDSQVFKTFLGVRSKTKTTQNIFKEQLCEYSACEILSVGLLIYYCYYPTVSVRYPICLSSRILLQHSNFLPSWILLVQYLRHTCTNIATYTISKCRLT